VIIYASLLCFMMLVQVSCTAWYWAVDMSIIRSRRRWPPWVVDIRHTTDKPRPCQSAGDLQHSTTRRWQRTSRSSFKAAAQAENHLWWTGLQLIVLTALQMFAGWTRRSSRVDIIMPQRLPYWPSAMDCCQSLGRLPSQIVEASSWSSSKSLSGPKSRWQPAPTSWCVKRRCQTLSSWIDASNAPRWLGLCANNDNYELFLAVLKCAST